MFAIFKRELFSFFNSLVAYIIIGIFLLACGLLLWFFPDTSILDYGYAELNGFFSLVPFLFMFLIPAITMRSFAEERREGTFVLLATKPLRPIQIVLAKYLACLILVLFALLPTLVYVYSINSLSLPKGNLDSGAVIGSYIGLCLLASAFTAVGIFASTLTKNQIVAFAVAVFVSFLAFNGFDAVAKLSALQNVETLITNFGVNSHYQSISRGVLDTRDVVYFFTFTALFIGFANLIIGGRRW